MLTSISSPRKIGPSLTSGSSMPSCSPAATPILQSQPISFPRWLVRMVLTHSSNAVADGTVFLIALSGGP